MTDSNKPVHGFFRRKLRTFKRNYQFLLLCVPTIVFTILFHYIPIFGIIQPFKQYRYVDGIFGSKWVGLKNFRAFFRTPDMYRLLRNTVGYSLWFMVVGIVMNVLIALLLYEITSKLLKKLYQTSIIRMSFSVTIRTVMYGSSIIILKTLSVKPLYSGLICGMRTFILSDLNEGEKHE